MSDLEVLILRLNTSSDRTAAAVIAKLVELGKPAVPRLIEAATDETKPRIRKWSLQALGAIGDARAAGLLMNSLLRP
ncbi:MAG: HEAT repeat domain-containing protein [Bdellovibrionota bacterium]